MAFAHPHEAQRDMRFLRWIRQLYWARAMAQARRETFDFLGYRGLIAVLIAFLILVIAALTLPYLFGAEGQIQVADELRFIGAAGLVTVGIGLVVFLARLLIFVPATLDRKLRSEIAELNRIRTKESNRLCVERGARRGNQLLERTYSGTTIESSEALGWARETYEELGEINPQWAEHFGPLGTEDDFEAESVQEFLRDRVDRLGSILDRQIRT